MTEKIPLLKEPSPDQVRLILQKIADLYSSPVQVIYEYVQNSIDSALLLKKEESHFTPLIIIHINHQDNEVIIQDNCTGMTKEEVTKNLTQKIFESKKKYTPWLLGEFGFGIQSFRSWFKQLTIATKSWETGEGITITFYANKAEAEIENELKWRIFGSVAEEINELPYLRRWREYFHSRHNIPLRKSGTDVILKKLIKKHKRVSLSTIVEELRNGLPIHFESYLKKGIIRILLIEWGTRQNKKFPYLTEIKPFHYEELEGEEIEGDIFLLNGRKIASYYFKIVDKEELGDPSTKKKVIAYQPSIQKLGMEINKIPALSSFHLYIEKHHPELDLSVWERPELVGYLNILDKKVNLGIHRTDLASSEEQEIIYEKMAELTQILMEKFEEREKKEVSKKEEALSRLLSNVVSQVAKELELEIFGRRRIVATPEGRDAFDENGVEEGLFKGEKGEVLPDELSPSPAPISPVEVKNEESNFPLDGEENGTNGISSEEGKKASGKSIKQKGISIEILSLGGNDLPSFLSKAEGKIIIDKDHPYYQHYLKERKNKFTQEFYMYLATVAAPWIVEEVFDKYTIRDKKERVRYLIETILKIEQALEKSNGWKK